MNKAHFARNVLQWNEPDVARGVVTGCQDDGKKQCESWEMFG